MFSLFQPWFDAEVGDLVFCLSIGFQDRPKRPSCRRADPIRSGRHDVHNRLGRNEVDGVHVCG
jgi:hypothetical protein